MRLLILAACALPLLAQADAVWTCIKPTGKVFQDHPCDSAEPVHQGVTVVSKPPGPPLGSPEWNARTTLSFQCEADHRNRNLYETQLAALPANANAVAAIYSDRIRAIDLELAEKCTPKGW